MVSVTALWLPIVLSAITVFVASSIMHIVLTYHRSDYGKLPNEEQILSALRTHGIPPGDYYFPHATSPGDLKNPEVLEKFNQGPVGLVTVMPSGPPTMGKAREVSPTCWQAVTATQEAAAPATNSGSRHHRSPSR